MSGRFTRSDDTNWGAPNVEFDASSGEQSGFENSQDFAASREEYTFEDDDNDACEDEESARAGDRAELKRLAKYSDSPDYYSLLGIARNPPPSDGQIRSAFHTLSLSFHPDKQPLHLQQAAREQYAKIQRAYDTLLNPQKRVVYDLLGEEGVKSEWETEGVMGSGGEAQEQGIGVKTMTSTEFRQWFLGVMKNKERAALENMIGSRVCTLAITKPFTEPNQLMVVIQGYLSVGLNAIPLFRRINLVPSVDNNSRPAQFVEASLFRVKHSFKAPLSRFRRASNADIRNDTSPYETFNSEYSGIPTVEAPKEAELIINAGVSGKIHRRKQIVEIGIDADGNKVTEKV
jgi:curved DNA-binding protein CbpA